MVGALCPLVWPSGPTFLLPWGKDRVPMGEPLVVVDSWQSLGSHQGLCQE